MSQFFKIVYWEFCELGCRIESINKDGLVKCSWQKWTMLKPSYIDEEDFQNLFSKYAVRGSR
jgi:hypothetical protein